MTTSLSWTPARAGRQYCSPACGRGCTFEEYRVAKASAETLATAMGWRTKVWENLGWHWAVISPCGRLKVHPSTGSGFFALLGGSEGPGGRWSAHGRTVREAVEDVVAAAKQEVGKLAQLVEDLPVV